MPPRFFAPLAVATLIVMLVTAALVQARPQPDLLLLTFSLVATATFCISWQASLRLDGAPQRPPVWMCTGRASSWRSA